MAVPLRLGPLLALLAALPGAALLKDPVVDPVAPAALVAWVAVAESLLPLHPVSAAPADTIVASKAIRSHPNPRLALVIKTPELCDPGPGPSGERSRQLKRGFGATEIPQFLTRRMRVPATPLS